jgi:site-specific DNA recombinase
MRACLYFRVSTEEQAKEGFSIEAQRALLDRKCAEWNYTIIKTYNDEGYSAKNMKRPALQQLIKDSESQIFDVVVYWRLDRLTRSSKDFHKLVEQLNTNKVGIKSATEQIDTTTAVGRFQLELSVSLAQLERETISERVTFVMEERNRKGLRNGSPAPLGYTLNEGKLIIHEEKAKIVQRIFNLYLEGNGMKQIAYILTREGYKSGYDSLMSGASIKYILQNPVYIGLVRWNYIDKTRKKTNNANIAESKHAPLISNEEFKQVQDEIARRGTGGKAMTSHFLFSSVLRCGRCGYHMHGFSYLKKNVRYKTYRCGGKYDYGLCDFPYVNENAVVKAFLDMLTWDDSEMEKLVGESEDQVKQVDRTESMLRELEAITNRRKNLRAAYANDVITLAELKDDLAEDEEREKYLKEQINAPRMKSWTKEALIEYMGQFKESWGLIDNDRAKKTFIQQTFESITIETVPESKIGKGFRTRVFVPDFKFRE